MRKACLGTDGSFFCLMERRCGGFLISGAATGGHGSAGPAASSVSPPGGAQLNFAATPLRIRTVLPLDRAATQKINAALLVRHCHARPSLTLNLGVVVGIGLGLHLSLVWSVRVVLRIVAKFMTVDLPFVIPIVT